MNDLARKIQILEIKVDMASKAEREARKADRGPLAAETLRLSNDLAKLYAQERAERGR